MNDDEKKAFLKKLGYGGSALAAVTGKQERTPKIRTDNRVDRDELLAAGKIFGVLPKVEKTPSFEEYLQQEEKGEEAK